ncbi:CaiB/BaiF CoA transferase family protein [Mesobacterium pallidum]|uniref:CaiB/BaiF CoA transferase family protein n=1 Tax=Mesobacterium pallidum TaxID=2872037 RepID=UPI001EE230E0|nr:CaiB/BaiF CoA-transferase family protein [Mesobacterium pallidum]
MSGPLSGLKVVEMAGLGPAPLAGQLLADLGAEVVLIARKSGPENPATVNDRGKLSVALNLKTPQGMEAAMALIARADVLIEGFRPGVMERMGLGPEPCAAVNPGLVFARMTGWGQDGPLAQTAGHDINYLGLTGILNAMGEPDRPPAPPLNIAADYGGGTMFLLFGIMAALYERQSSGKGQVVDAAMVDGAAALMGLIHSFRARGQWTSERQANMLDGAAPFYRCYTCADGKFLAVGPLEPQFFAKLVELAGLPREHLGDQNDPRNWAERRDLYAKVFASKPRDDWAAIFDGSDACATPVLDWEEAPEHPHLAARGTYIEVAGVPQPAPAPRFDRTPAPAPTPPHAPGSDTRAVLAAAGYDDATLDALAAAGVLT